MPWSHPAARMKEYVQAMRAIWHTWMTGERLQFRGKYYTHTLMTPFFTPTTRDYGAPKVLLAGVGPLMTKVAGEVADGIILHAFTTEKYLREVTLPAVDEGLALSGRTRKDFQISYPVFVVTGRDEKELQQNSIATRKQIAFYGSTPAYKGVLECIGAHDLQPRLNIMSKEGRWDEMGTLITDDILREFAVVAEPQNIAREIKARYGDVIDRTSAAYANLSRETRMQIIRELA
jgi:probable F420-dependent oxidoreductase